MKNACVYVFTNTYTHTYILHIWWKTCDIMEIVLLFNCYIEFLHVSIPYNILFHLSLNIFSIMPFILTVSWYTKYLCDIEVKLD